MRGAPCKTRDESREYSQRGDHRKNQPPQGLSAVPWVMTSMTALRGVHLKEDEMAEGGGQALLVCPCAGAHSALSTAHGSVRNIHDDPL